MTQHGGSAAIQHIGNTFVSAMTGVEEGHEVQVCERSGTK